MNDAKAVAISGAFIMAFTLILLGMFFGVVAVFLAVICAFGTLMTCVGVEVVNERMEKSR